MQWERRRRWGCFQMQDDNGIDPNERVDDCIRENQAIDTRTVDELVRDALALYGNVDWPAVDESITLHKLGTQDALHAAQALCHSIVVIERKLGAYILGQLGWDSSPFSEERFTTLSSMLDLEQDELVLADVIYALGHLHDARGIEPLAIRRTHHNPEVREAVAFALAGYDDPLAIRTLIALSCDEEAAVRDWATFAIAKQTEVDSTEIREAMVARLGDKDIDTWGEALLGLALRKDPRVVNAVLATRDAGFYDANTIEAAILAMKTFGDQRLCTLLNWLLETLHQDNHWFPQDELQDAIGQYCADSTSIGR